ncbi:MAG: hypothetical protein P4M11_14245 [Candidatus Pacebacteria bacterium]|nr:hypothetical protein [Candidatus Paceibacterota bacterium]
MSASPTLEMSYRFSYVKVNKSVSYSDGQSLYEALAASMTVEEFRDEFVYARCVRRDRSDDTIVPWNMFAASYDNSRHAHKPGANSIPLVKETSDMKVSSLKTSPLLQEWKKQGANPRGIFQTLGVYDQSKVAQLKKSTPVKEEKKVKEENKEGEPKQPAPTQPEQSSPANAPRSQPMSHTPLSRLSSAAASPSAAAVGLDDEDDEPMPPLEAHVNMR